MTKRFEIWRLLIALPLVSALSILIPSNAEAYDLWKEKEITENLLPLINESKHLWLKLENGRKLFALYESNISQPKKGGVILLPNINSHVDWPSLIRPLRRELTLNGWQVLTIQSPSNSHNLDSIFLLGLPEEIGRRINTAIDHYTSNNINNIVLIAHGHSANLAAQYLHEGSAQKGRILAFAGISFRHYSLSSEWPDSNKNLERIKIPFLDIHGRLANPLVKEAAHQRLNSAHISGSGTGHRTKQPLTAKVAELAHNKTGNLAYRQIQLSNSDYNLNESNSNAAKIIRAWLSTHATN